jgi:ATP-dependent DNA helicase Q4
MLLWVHHPSLQAGRAGRDGSQAVCHLLLDSEDYLRLRSLMHSAACTREGVLGLLRHIFAPLQQVSW